jgi:hypothetical protein
MTSTFIAAAMRWFDVPSRRLPPAVPAFERELAGTEFKFVSVAPNSAGGLSADIPQPAQNIVRSDRGAANDYSNFHGIAPPAMKFPTPAHVP